MLEKQEVSNSSDENNPSNVPAETQYRSSKTEHEIASYLSTKEKGMISQVSLAPSRLVVKHKSKKVLNKGASLQLPQLTRKRISTTDLHMRISAGILQHAKQKPQARAIDIR